MDIPITPSFLSQIGVVSETVLILLLLIFNKGITLQSRVKDRDEIIAKQDLTIESKDATIEWQRESLVEKDKQIADLTRAAQMSAAGFQKVSQAAEQIAGNGS